MQWCKYVAFISVMNAKFFYLKSDMSREWNEKLELFFIYYPKKWFGWNKNEWNSFRRYCLCSLVEIYRIDNKIKWKIWINSTNSQCDQQNNEEFEKIYIFERQR
jgi:hypothetical protein